eukprot:409818_1
MFAILEYFPLASILEVRTGFCCCSSSDYYLYYKNKKRKKKKKKLKKNKKRKKLKQNHHSNATNSANNNSKVIIKNCKIKNELMINHKHNKAHVQLNKKRKKRSRARKMENERNYRKSYWFFEALRFEVDGSLYSLREIERDIICSKFAESDARILCCLNKQCIGSPKLLNKPYESHLLNEQLNTMNRMWCSGVVKDKDLCLRDTNICISSLFKHFKSHYIKYAKKNKWSISNRHHSIDNDHGALLGYIYHFANKEMRNKLSYPILSGYCIKYIEFDWRLSMHKSRKEKAKAIAMNNGNETKAK